MSFKLGDVVIKITGGDKMTIDEILDGNYKCIWFTDTHLKEQVFSENEIVSIPDYKRLLITEERQDKINKIFRS